MFVEKKRVFEPIDRIEFAFVLLPDDSVLSEIKEISEEIKIILYDMSPTPPSFYGGSYVHKSVTIPHISVGQYGVLGCEIDTLKENIKNLCQHTSCITEKMKETLSVLDDHIFLDVERCFKEVNPSIEKIYDQLRTSYFENVKTRFPIAQALMNKHKYEDPEEIALIEHYFQNWGTPEKNRIRPHFTMIYNYCVDKEQVFLRINNSVEIKNRLINLKTVHLKKLGAIQIDPFGNPLEDGWLFVAPLKG